MKDLHLDNFLKIQNSPQMNQVKDKCFRVKDIEIPIQGESPCSIREEIPHGLPTGIKVGLRQWPNASGKTVAQSLRYVHSYTNKSLPRSMLNMCAHHPYGHVHQ